MMRSSNFGQFIDQVRAATDIAALIGADVDLRPSGSTLKGMSPFQPEQHPSFVVWPDTQTWRDFSGGGSLGGDVFDYVQRREHLGFMDALQVLAQRAGCQAPDQDEEAFRKQIALALERREVHQLLTQAAAFYHQALPQKIRKELYHDHYGFSDDTIDSLQLGWANGHLFEYFTEDLQVERSLALKTGLFVVLRGGRVEEFFVNRLVFPYWQRGHVVYFIARKTRFGGDEPWEQAKYKKLLTHSERHNYVSQAITNGCFYNEDAARGADELLITEGVTDCISAMQAGVRCISPVTVRFRRQDLPRLLQLTQRARRVVVCNDAEESGAGAAGALNTAKALYDSGQDVRIAELPRPVGVSKVDLNEYLRDNPPEALAEVLGQAQRYVAHLITAIPEKTSTADLEPLLDPVLQAVSVAGELERDAYLDAIVDRFGVRRRSLTGRLKSVRRKAAAQQATEGPLPSVQVNGRQLREVLDEARAIAVDANSARVQVGATTPPGGDDPPLLFRRGGRLAHLKTDADTVPELATLGDTAMFGVLVRDADWYAVDDEGAHHAASPSKDVARDLVTFPPAGLPRVDSVITTPVFGKNGDLVVSPGLHPEEHLWLQLDSSLDPPQVPRAPSKDDIALARELFLGDLFVDFPFASDADRAHILAAVLLPFARRMIHGNTPLHLVESPSIGSGKSLLCHLISIVCTGKDSEISTLPGQEEEVRKTLTAELLKACPIIVLDNANERRIVNSQALAAALTAPTWRSRILGKTEMIVLPNLAMWMLTGNNPRLSGELTRRSVSIRIDPKRDRAWQRTGFKHDPISRWATEHRSELVHAALVLIQAWIAAGRPRGDVRLGSFEDWAAILGGILEVVQVPGFLSNLEQMYADADSDGEMWREFTKTWWSELGDDPKRVSEINDLCEREDLMLVVRGDGADRSQHVRLGRALLSARDRVFGDLRIVAERTRHRSRQYRLQSVSGAQAQVRVQAQAQSHVAEIDPWQ